jgi:xylan 1,4-beta-xylosidase
MSASFKCDVNGAASALPHFREHTVGSDHALMALRADWREQMQRAHDELGFRHVRFHGLLCDDVGTLISEGDELFYSFLVAHWVERYGINEVRQWFFEVWNEPNLDAFGSAKQDDYFKLYRYTAEAIKSVDGALKVGGPATAANAWIDDFIGFCTKSQLPSDFISTHHYPANAF